MSQTQEKNVSVFSHTIEVSSTNWSADKAPKLPTFQGNRVLSFLHCSSAVSHILTTSLFAPENSVLLTAEISYLSERQVSLKFLR